ncbi:uncharacterized protein LOC142979915 isoform X2 [Anticarsia gemmatalis]|uniref:uncharacterized protein LOC142979915 isoform X2 n=1 Tax=Anticarsia gemmatalis TaxID=129554 RepID=UPI003F76ECFC
MESSKDSASARNPCNFDGDAEKNSNRRSTSSQPEPRENAENIFASTSNQSSGFVPSSRSRENHMNSLPCNEPAPQSSNLTENTHETSKHSSTTGQSQMCNNKVSNSNTDHTYAVASSSRTVTNIIDNGTETNQDVQSCQRHKKCIEKAGGSGGNPPSASSSGRVCDNSENNTFKVNRKRPSSLKLDRSDLDDDSSSDTGNDDYSLGSEDGCIYTYRGGEHLADLPSSFFSLDMGLPLENQLPLPNLPAYAAPQQGAAPAREGGSRASSPDMEFLEMDFDPGPSCEVDTDEESEPDVDLEVAGNMVEEIEPAMIRAMSPEYVAEVVAQYDPVIGGTSASTSHKSEGERSSSHYYSHPVPISYHSGMDQGDSAEGSSYSFGPYITHVNTRGEQLLVRRTMSLGTDLPMSLQSGHMRPTRGHLNCEDEHIEKPHAYHANQGSLIEQANVSQSSYHMNMAKKLMADKNRSEAEAQNVVKAGTASGSATAGSSSSAGCVEPPRSMIWSEAEACERQVTQIATSACGATAVVNVFNALGVPVNLERISSAVGTRQRANNAPLPRYLLSRAVAGCTAADLVSGIHRASDGLVTARFFPTYPERAVSLSHWLADWITLGGVPILTLNLQAGSEGEIPDAWHHQMVFGVSPRGIYLCNPVECVREGVLWPQLTSPSVLLIRSRDVLSRFTAHTDLTPLMAVPDRRFHTFNVLGQVANVIREWRAIGWGDYGTRTRHVRIPAAYAAGVTVGALTGSEAHRRLVAAPLLPVLRPPADP